MQESDPLAHQQGVDEPDACAHCGYPIDQQFCSQCGQKHVFEAPTVKGFVLALFHRYFHNATVFLRTTRDMIRRPATVMDAYLGGDHLTYQNPFSYFLFIAGLAAIITLKFSAFNPESAIQFWQETYAKMGIPMNEGSNKSMLITMSWMREHYNIVLMMTIPFFAWGTKILFRKRQKPYSEFFILTVYVISCYTLIVLPLLPFMNPGDLSESNNYITYPIFLAFYTWVFMDYFNVHWFRGILITVGTFILSQLLIMLFSIVIGIVGAIVAIIGVVIMKKTGLL